jgi:hypothetical protein
VNKRSPAKNAPLTQIFSDESIGVVKSYQPMRNAESQQTIKLQNELKNIYKEPLENFNLAPNSNQNS